jgi:heme exporter protein C
MIWGHSSWNTWWRWEPRLTSVLILWLLLFALRYCNRISFQSEEKETFMSILGVISAVQAPIIIYSIKLLNRTEQLHPEIVAKQGLKDHGYVLAMIYNNFSLLLLAIWLCRLTYRYLKIEDARIKIKRKL